jgi:hypothetical protein
MACARKLLIYADTVAQRGTPWTERPLSFNGCYRMVSGDDGLKPWLGVGWLAVDLQALGRRATQRRNRGELTNKGFKKS